MVEIWKDVKGYEGFYQVSNFGRVRSLHFNHTNQCRILKPQTMNKGYQRVELGFCGKSKKYLIHVLVAQAFIPNYSEKLDVNHKDENPSNNKVSNLECLSRKENALYSINKHPERQHRKSIIQMDLKGNVITVWESILRASKELKIDRSSISQCLKGVYTHAGGYRWKLN